MDPHEDLLSRWRRSDPTGHLAFISDGIVDEARWRTTSCRVLFLLKEAYGERDATLSWDLREVLRDQWKGPRYNVWTQVSNWSYAVHSGAEAPRMPSDDIERRCAIESLLSSAVINIKKSRGVASSDMEEIRSLAKRDGAFVREQVDLISPDIIICGNTWDAVKHLWPEAREVYDLVHQEGRRLFIDFWHPANRYHHKLSYYALQGLLKKSLFARA